MSFPDLSSLRSLLCIHFTRNKDAWAACDEWVAARERRLSVWLISAHFTSIINECSNRMKRKTFHFFTTLFSVLCCQFQIIHFLSACTQWDNGEIWWKFARSCCSLLHSIGWVFARNSTFRFNRRHIATLKSSRDGLMLMRLKLRIYKLSAVGPVCSTATIMWVQALQLTIPRPHQLTISCLLNPTTLAAK